ncbi:hypothetical protein WA026_011137 [Henosepilachna vigintioctopunctata]|uniref:Uncharacterized protein n=1 Tax=Henosepilachna vigintioctopunctata TaxID=420089 RepID=A0AAW1U609_9CUCU
MSITCSIPGCNRRYNLSDDTKLYRVPAVAIGCSESSGLIYNVTNERRKKWFEVLETCGLNEENSSSYRVCSNHFKDGKPSPLFDSNSTDWAPSLNLPFLENVTEGEILELQGSKEKSKRGRQNKRDTKRGNSSERSCPVRSKSVERSNSQRNRNSFARSKSVCRSKFFENENSLEKKSSDQPFVFVDIKKIKEGAPITFRDLTPSSQSHKENIIKMEEVDVSSRSLGTQTNADFLTPSNCEMNKLENQHDTQFQTSAVQTNPVSMLELFVSDNSSFQASLGEMIEFECALHFQKEGEEVNNTEEEEANTVVVHPTRLLSSNWKLLEAVAISLDLYRLQDKNKSGYSRILDGKTETIEKISNNFDGNESWRNQLKEIDNNNEYALRDIVINDDENGNRTGTESPVGSLNKNAATSPVLPRITSVISIGELLKDTTPKSTVKKSASRKKLASAVVPSPKSTPTITRITPRNSSVVRKKPIANLASLISSSRSKKKIPYIKNMRRTRLENNTVIQRILGTYKVPRVVLHKLPDTVFEKSGRVPFSSSLLYTYTHRNSSPTKSRSKNKAVSNKSTQRLWVSGSSNDANSSTKIARANEVKNSSLPFKSVKNIPLKLSQSSGVAGYLLVPDVGAMGGKAPLMYVPKPNEENIDRKLGSLNHKNSDDPTPTEHDINLSNISDSATNTMAEMIPSNVAQLGSPRDGVSRRKKMYNSGISVESDPKDDVDEDILTKSDILEEISNGGKALLRCPYCLKNCKDGLDFINHHKTTGCKGKKNLSPIRTNNKKKICTEGFHDCNVCGKVFVKPSQLEVHLQKHVEYEVWDEKCAECPKRFATTEELQDHFLDRHSWKIKIAKFECEECEKRFTTRKRLECHIEKKHPLSTKKKGNINIRCKFCRKIFDIEHYRQVHWRKCQEMKRKREIKDCSSEITDKSLDEMPIVIDKVKITKAHRDMKVKVTTRTSDKDKLIRSRRQVENNEIIEVPRKPTAIRTIKNDHLNDDLEAQLSRMFEEDISQDSSSSEYEHEELLEEGFEDELSTLKKNLELNGNKGMKRLMKLKETISNDEYF